MKKVHSVLFFCYLLHLVGVFGVKTDEVKSVSVMEGESVTLQTHAPEIRKEDVIMWKFGSGIPLAKINNEARKSSTFNGSHGEFRGRLLLDFHTGDLTITNITSNHSGLYQLTISSKQTPFKMFNVTVYARLPIPVISRDSSQNSSSKCVLLCSVVKVTQVTLSWYKGNRLLNKTSASHLTTKLSLPLEVENQENNLYSCVINNNFVNQTQQLDINHVCQPCSEHCCDLCCSFTEAVIRLVLSGLVGMAVVAVLVYDIRSRGAEQKRKGTSIPNKGTSIPSRGTSILSRGTSFPSSSTSISSRSTSIPSSTTSIPTSTTSTSIPSSTISIPTSTTSTSIPSSTISIPTSTNSIPNSTMAATRHAVSRATEVLEQTENKTFLKKTTMLHAYMHFEALTTHNYSYSCFKCGYYPPVVVMDLHRKSVFNMPVITNGHLGKNSAVMRQIQLACEWLEENQHHFTGKIRLSKVLKMKEDEALLAITMRDLFMNTMLYEVVFGAETDQVKTVTEGGSVTLNTDNGTQGYIMLEWMFVPIKSIIARVDGEFKKVSYVDNKLFRDRIQLDQTGFLTIRNIRTKHSGQYKAEITSSKGTSSKIFSVIVNDSPLVHKQKEELKTMSVKEGDTVILNNNGGTHGDELILWRFGPEGSLIAKCDKEDNNISLYDSADGSFKGRLQLDQTGSLTITNTRVKDTGFYHLHITNNIETKHRIFSVAVSALGLSSGGITGMCVSVLLLVAATAAAGVIYRTCKPKVKRVIMMKGDPVPLSTDDTRIQRYDVNVYFGNALIAEIRRGKVTPVDDEYSNRLQLDQTAGSLTITNTTDTDSGDYKLNIIIHSREITYKRINVTVYGDKVFRKRMMEGVSLTLNTTEIQKDAVIVKFENTVIANKKQNDGNISYEDVLGGMFKGRLHVNLKTGSFTIPNSRITDSGVFDININSTRANIQKRFKVTVYDKEMSVMKGESVTLCTSDTHIQRDDLNMYYEDTLIAEIRRGEITPVDERFRGGRLLVGQTAGCLTITNTKSTDSGFYTLKIISGSSGEITYKRLFVTVDGDKVFRKQVQEGHSVILYMFTEIQKDAIIVWRFENTVIANKKQNDGNISYEDVLGGKFRDRLHVNLKTGSLTIQNGRITDSGEYDVKIINSRANIHKRFDIAVCDSTGSKKKESTVINVPPKELVP
ncbi:uncharacterized protein LOC127412254 [Myxocyprinus asiaticus]|uniref:uncharacterized protein LOC127412254 n=1 Tax=Myxocyprinus asiaticus TaxID=70543 RepID=UPI002221C136|nr:uncharacterized protein LOC127412254 [Myxocyprinus asiaticus]